PPQPTLFPYTTLFRSLSGLSGPGKDLPVQPFRATGTAGQIHRDRSVCRKVRGVIYSCEALQTGSSPFVPIRIRPRPVSSFANLRSEEHTSELQSRGHL